jgi:HPt (histidine-containing phosphotransfer) domain-containing protein
MRLPSTDMPDFAELQRNYVLQLSVTFEELQEALAADDRELLQRVAHRIMGTSGLYGLPTVGESAKKLHHAVLTGQPNETLETVMRQLKLEVQQVARPSISRSRPR